MPFWAVGEGFFVEEVVDTGVEGEAVIESILHRKVEDQLFADCLIGISCIRIFDTFEYVALIASAERGF